MPRLVFILLAGLAPAACTLAPPLTVAATRCDIARHQSLVGMNIGEVNLPRQLDQRTITPGQIVDNTSRPQRLNIVIDAKGWIEGVSCG